MRSSNKSRSRNKNRNNRSNNNLGNVVNRVFDSSGPEGKVRGTPQQIIDKYQSLARDAQLGGDRVAHENFLQHAEHYVRMLSEAQREMDQRREQQDAQRQQNQQNHNPNNQNNQPQHNNQNQQNSGGDTRPSQPAPPAAVDDQPVIPEGADLFPGKPDTSNLVETPESKPAAEKPRTRRAPKPKPPAAAPEPAADDAPQGDSPKAAE